MTVETKPREIVETTRWVPVGAPATCANCGHLHYSRVPEPNLRNLAPQWRYCEDPDCGCTGLRR